MKHNIENIWETPCIPYDMIHGMQDMRYMVYPRCFQYYVSFFCS